MADPLQQERAGDVGGDAERLHRQAARLAAEWMAGQLADFWTTLQRQQAKVDVATSGYSAHQANLGALHLLVSMQPEWLSGFRQGLEASALAWGSGHSAMGRGRALGLMSEIELSVHLQAQQLASELGKTLAPVLANCDRQVAALAAALNLRGSTGEVGNPWGPEGVLRAFAESLPLDEINHGVATIAFDGLRARLPGVYGQVVPNLSALLAGAGVLLPESAPTRADPDRSQTPGRVDTGLAEPRVGPDTLANLRAHPVVEPGAGSVPAPAVDASRLPRYRDIVHGHLEQWRTRARQAGTWASPGATNIDAQVLRSAEVLTMATILQGEDPARYAAALERQGVSSLQCVIREEITQAATQLGFEQERIRFSQDDEDAIDLVAMLFTVLAEGNDLLPRSTRMFGRLVLPYVKVAMLDDSLFNRRSHPARRLLDALAEACDGNAGESAPNREMLDRAEDVVEQVVVRFQEDQAIFELAAKELQDFLQQQKLRAEVSERRLAEALHGRERLQFAREAARNEVSIVLESTRLADATGHFLQEHWQRGLVQTWLRHGADSMRYRAQLALGGELAALDGEGAALHGDALARGVVARLPALRECLASSGLAGTGAEEAIARLCAGLADAGAERKHLAGSLEPAEEEPRTESLRVASKRTAVSDPLLVARLRKLRVGQGLRVREEEGRESAARIAWISPLTSRFLIVNRRGIRKLVVSPEELAELVEAGEVTVRAVDAPVDHAMRQVWEQLRAAGATVH